MPKKIDPLNKKQYSAVSAILTVTDVKTAMNFYQKALGFTKRSIMNGPDRKPIHAELTLRDTTLMLSPESPAMGALKWTPLSRPFSARNKLMFDGPEFEFGAASHQGRPLPFRRSKRRSGRIPAEPCLPFRVPPV